jgi:hypothetical protein
MRNLTDQQEKFCQCYGRIGSETLHNGTQSAIEAGFSEKTAAVQASQMLAREDIQQRLAEIDLVNLQVLKLNGDWTKSEILDALRVAKERKDLTAVKNFLDLLSKITGLYRDRPDSSSSNVLEPSEPEEREAWLKRELQIIQEQKEAGDGLPRE